MSIERLAGLERWVKEKYLILYKIFGDKPFTLRDAEDALRKSGVEPGNVKLLMAELQKAGLAKATKYAIDERYTQYQLIPISVTSVNREEMLRLAKAAADLIRTGVDYKVIPLFIFYKAISDIYMARVNEYVKQGLSREDAYLLVNHEYMKLYDEEKKELLTWHEVTRSGEIHKMANAIKDIVRMNDIDETGKKKEALDKVASLVDVVGLTGFISQDNMHILTQIIDLFNKVDFSQVTYDVIGDTYQWVLRYFAPQKAKEGEVYTPLEVVKLIVRLLDIEDNTKVLDPAVGSGAMLIEAYRYVKSKLGGGEPHIMLYGQDRNEVTAALAEMNLMLNNIVNHRIYIGDSLINLRLEETDYADYVLANPPWNQDGYGEEVLSRDPRLRKIYHYGYPPDNTADWAWVQLMIYYARKKVGIVLDQGALFRGGREKSIREGIVKDDLLEAVILLPEKLFYNTQAPGVILIFNKEKPQERRRKVLFINASNEYVKHPEVRRLNMLSDANIEKIVNAYREFKDIPGFARVVTVEEIERNDYNLNVTLYVTPQMETEEIDLERELRELLEVNRQVEEAMTKAMQYIQQVIQANRQG